MNDAFAEKAKEWDLEPRRMAMADRFAAELNNIVPDCSGLTLLELGCGTGLVGLRYAGKAATLHMVDTSPAMLDVLRTKEAVAAHNVLMHEGTLEALGGSTIEHGTIDWLFSNMALHHVEDIPALIKEMALLMKPGGHVTIGDLVTEPGTFHAPDTVPHNGFDPPALARLFTEHGFAAANAHTYHTIPKEDKDGVTRTYSTFVLVATR